MALRARPLSPCQSCLELESFTGKEPQKSFPGAQICTALAHTSAWSLPFSSVSSLDPSIGKSSPAELETAPVTHHTSPLSPRAQAPE